MEKVKVLLVDDDPNVIELLNLYLAKEGFQTVSAGDGREALRMARGVPRSEHEGDRQGKDKGEDKSKDKGKGEGEGASENKGGIKDEGAGAGEGEGEGEALAPQLIILDVMLPDLDGWAVLKRLRDEGIRTPVIMLTAKSEDHDKILGLELGADDYVAKPFNPIEVVARVKAVLRRTYGEGVGGGIGGNAGIAVGAAATGVAAPTAAGTGAAGGVGAHGMGRSWEEEVVTYPGLSVSLSDYEVRVDGQPVPFTRKEIELLWVLASNPGRAFTREQLIERVWGGDFYGDDRTVDVHIKRIREKLSAGARGATGAKGASEAGEAGEVEQGGGEEAREIRQAPTAAEMERREEHPWRIKTVWGVGYKFELLD